MTAQEKRLQRRMADAEKRGALACQVPGCRAIIGGFTGFDQLQKLIKHYARAHLVTIWLHQAIELRERMEQAQRAALAAERAARA